MHGKTTLGLHSDTRIYLEFTSLILCSRSLNGIEMDYPEIFPNKLDLVPEKSKVSAEQHIQNPLKSALGKNNTSD